MAKPQEARPKVSQLNSKICIEGTKFRHHKSITGIDMGIKCDLIVAIATPYRIFIPPRNTLMNSSLNLLPTN